MTLVLQSAVAASLGVQQLASAFSPAFSHLRILRNLIIPCPKAVPCARQESMP